MWNENGGYKEVREARLHPRKERCIYSIPEKGNRDHKLIIHYYYFTNL